MSFRRFIHILNAKHKARPLFSRQALAIPLIRVSAFRTPRANATSTIPLPSTLRVQRQPWFCTWGICRCTRCHCHRWFNSCGDQSCGSSLLLFSRNLLVFAYLKAIYTNRIQDTFRERIRWLTKDLIAALSGPNHLSAIFAAPELLGCTPSLVSLPALNPLYKSMTVTGLCDVVTIQLHVSQSTFSSPIHP